jgi:hypothetical protein
VIKFESSVSDLGQRQSKQLRFRITGPILNRVGVATQNLSTADDANSKKSLPRKCLISENN